ncbi:MAG: phage terminase large subunit family protein [Pyrinomonadaceae bacterium MAG19_C2-C3]|nr:phage terminase large subunit family protein [Pyrinomonadaceae bacterium MAG19_C2-C3]
MNSVTTTQNSWATNSDSVIRESLLSAIPESDLTIDGWADTYRFLSPERSARPGRWSTDLVPYLREPMRVVTNSDVVEVVFMASSQIAKTEFCNNVLGYFIHIDPSPILYLCENEGKAEAWSKECLAPMIRDTPVLAKLIGEARMRDSGNTTFDKRFPGGHLALAWATSPATLSSRPRRVVLADECDGYAPTNEGDPMSLAEKRTTTFTNKKILKVSSPRDELTSTIEPAYRETDMRRYFVPCPHCDEFQILEWKRVKWDDTTSDAYYVCVNGCLIEHDSKTEMLASGEWRVTNPQPTPGKVGFWINELYSPFVDWTDMRNRFLIAKRKGQETLKVFINTSLAETWKAGGEEIDTDDLLARCEFFAAEVPVGVKVLTAGVDVQNDRLECEIVGWGEDKESWSIAYRIIEGDPTKKQVWEELKDILTRDYECEPLDDDADIRNLRVAAVAVDSGGHHTHEVYKFTRSNAGRRFHAIKGANTPGKPLASRPSKVGTPPTKLYIIGTETAKDSIAAALEVAEPGPNYCHFPDGRDAEYFKQLRSERAVMRYVGRRQVRTWEKRKPSLRNEALDVRVYAMAALAILNPDFKAMRRRAQHQPLAAATVQTSVLDTPAETTVVAEDEPVISQPPVPNSRRARRRIRGNGFVNNW